MRMIAIETSGTIGGIALAEAAQPEGPSRDRKVAGTPAFASTRDLTVAARDEAHTAAPPLQIVEEVHLTEGMRHARDLVLTMKAACERAGWSARQLDVVALSIGPGSFTGIRVAVTVAKFVAWDTGAKIVAVPSLRAMVENVPADCIRAATILDAKRGGLFASIFERRPPAAPGATGGLPASAREGPAPCTEVQAPCDDAPVRARCGSSGLLTDFAEIFGPALIEPVELAKRLQGPAMILGHGVPKAEDALAAFNIAPRELWDIRPTVVARLGYHMHLVAQYADPLRLEPVYIRPPDAQEVWERNQSGGTP